MTPQPGIYENIPFAEYCEWDAISNSELSLFDKSPRAYHKGSWKEPTTSMRVGSLDHCLLLEPAKFAARYTVQPDFHLDEANCTADGRQTTSKATSYVKAKAKAFGDLNAGREVVEQSWYDNALSLLTEVEANETAAAILFANQPAEVSILWEERGLPMKARIDKLGDGILVDLKTTNDACNFACTIARYGYHRQMAHYQRGWHALTGESRACWLVAVEPNPPHTVLAAPLSDDALSEGHAARARLLDGLEACLFCDVWPAKPNPKYWELPAWATESIELIHEGREVQI